MQELQFQSPMTGILSVIPGIFSVDTIKCSLYNENKLGDSIYDKLPYALKCSYMAANSYQCCLLPLFFFFHYSLTSVLHCFSSFIISTSMLMCTSVMYERFTKIMQPIFFPGKIHQVQLVSSNGKMQVTLMCMRAFFPCTQIAPVAISISVEVCSDQPSHFQFC